LGNSDASSRRRAWGIGPERLRLLAQTDWQVMGGKMLHHELGVGMETGEMLIESSDRLTLLKA